MKKINIITLDSSHFSAWQALYFNYAEFYKTVITAESSHITWDWIMTNTIFGLGIEVDDELVGFAHWQANARPLTGSFLAYLHDLYILPTHRGGGLASQLIERVARDAKTKQCNKLRWATKQDNTTARGLYDKIATATDWVIYDKNLD